MNVNKNAVVNSRVFQTVKHLSISIFLKGGRNMSVRSLSFLTCLSVLFAVAVMVGTAQAEAIYDDFSTDPNLATDWSNYARFIATGTATWNATDLDLDLAAAGTVSRVSGLYRTTPAASRSATDPVTLTIKEYSATAGGDWATVGLLIAKNAEPALIGAGEGPWYSFEIAAEPVDNGWNYLVRTTNNNKIYIGTTGVASTPIKLDIVRDGDYYRFKANDTLIFSDDAVDRFGSSAEVALPYYEIQWGSNATGTMSATVDNFGVIPEPTTFALIATGALGFLLVALRRRRRK